MQQINPKAIAVWTTLARVGPHVQSRVESELKRQGHPPLAWYDVLWELEQAENGLRPRDLGARLLITRYNLSRLLDRLESEGLIVRENCSDDKRGQIIRATRAGRAMHMRMWPAYAAALHDAIERRYSPEEMDTLTDLLDRLR